MNNIIEIIATEISGLFPELTIYGEHQEQKFKDPCIYIYEINTVSKDELMGYQTRHHNFCITYFPDSRLDNPGFREQCMIIEKKLLNEFTSIKQVSLKVLNREAKIEQDSLNVTFKLRYRLIEEKEQMDMKDLDQQGGVKFE